MKTENLLQKHFQGVTIYLILTFIILSTVTFLIGYSFYYNQLERLKTEKQNELTAIAELKIKQINDWRQERLGDAHTISSNKALLDDLIKYIDKTGTTSERKNIENWLSILLNVYKYSSVYIMDNNYILISKFDGNGNSSPISENDEYLKNYLKDSNYVLKSFLTDFHYKENSTKQELDLIVPIFNEEDNIIHTHGFLVLEINPYDFLFPLVNTWPIYSKSSENILAKRDGDSVRILNEPRFKDLVNFNTVSADRKDIAAVAGVFGFNGIFEGKDYRGTEIISYINQVPGTSWIIVSKIDKDEVYSAIRSRSYYSFIMILICMLLSSLIVLIIWRNQRVKFYKHQYNIEVEKRALMEHFEYLTKYANDIILLFDKYGNIIEANEKALNTYGYSRDEFLKLNVIDLRHPDKIDLLNFHVKELYKKGSIVVESEHIKKGKSAFPVESSMRIINIKGETFIQSIVRDISERKKSEEKLRESEERFRGLAENNSVHIMEFDEKLRYTYVNPTTANYIGGNAENFIGKTARDIFGNTPLVDKWEEWAINVLKTGKQFTNEFESHGKHFTACLSPSFSNTGKVISVIVSSMDVTALKLAEEKLHTSEEKFRSLTEFNNIHIMQFDRNYRHIYLNPAAAKYMKKFSKECIGKTSREVFGEKPLEDLWEKNLEQVFKTGKSMTLDFESEGKYYTNQLSPIFSKTGEVSSVIVSSMDISVLKNAEMKILGLNRVYSLLSEANQSIVRTKDKKELLDKVCNIAVEIGKLKFAWIGFINDETQIVEPYSWYPKNSKFLDGIIISADENAAEGRGPISMCLRENKPITCDDIRKCAKSKMWLSRLMKAGFGSSCSIPLSINGKIIGVFNLYAEKPNFFIEEEVKILFELACDISFALESFDTSEHRNRAEAALNESEEKFRLIAENSLDIICMLNEKYEVTYISPSLKKVLGYDKEHIIGKKPSYFIHPDDIYQFRNLGVPLEFKLRLLNAKGEWIWVEGNSYNVNSASGMFYVGIARDITERINAENQINESLIEKELLLKEIHHRVKNNLQIISSLLKLQSAFVKNKEDKNILLESQNRVKTMALIHQSLYKSNNLSKINFEDYLKNLIINIIEVNRDAASKIKVNFDAKDVFFNMDTAIPCGLLVNELVTNAYKHAFQGIIKTGIIDIIVKQEEVNKFNLKVKDNGIGLPADFDIENTPNMGSQLIMTLVEQLDGKLDIQNGTGTAFNVSFYGLKYKERVEVKNIYYN